MPQALSAAGIGPDEAAFTDAVAPRLPGRGAARGVTRVAVAGAAGRMGQAVCAAVEGADDLELVGRADPALGVDARQRAGRRRRRRRLHPARPGARQRARGPRRGRARRHRHHRLRPRGAALGGRGRLGQRLRRPQLRDRRGADDALRRRGVAAHGGRRDHRVPPPGQARQAVGHRRAHRRADGGRRADPLRAAAGHRRRPGRDPRRRGPDADASATSPPTARASCPACCSRCGASRSCPSRPSSGSSTCCGRRTERLRSSCAAAGAADLDLACGTGDWRASCATAGTRCWPSSGRELCARRARPTADGGAARDVARMPMGSGSPTSRSRRASRP